MMQVREAFVKYAKFIINGNEDGELDIGTDFNNWAIAGIATDTLHEQQEYMSKLRTYEKDFSNALAKSDFAKDEDMSVALSGTISLMSAYELYTKTVQSNEDIIRQYKASGYNATLQDNKIPQESFADPLAKAMANDVQTYLESFLNLARIAERNGCISRDTIDGTNANCKDSDDFMKFYRKNATDYSNLRKCASSILSVISMNLSNMEYRMSQ